MASIFVLLILGMWHVLAVAIPTSHVALFATAGGGAPMITSSPSVPATQNLPAIFSSIASLLGALHPPPSISNELSAFPTSILSGLQGPNAMSAFDALYTDKGITWFTALPSDAESWVLGLPKQAATVLPQVISLQSVANNAFYPSLATPTVGPPTNDFFSSAMSAVDTVTATINSNARRGITEGQEIGIIVGLAAFITFCVTGGVMIYDVRKKALIANQLRQAQAERQQTHPPRTYIPSRTSQQFIQARQSQGSQALREPATEFGGEERPVGHQKASGSLEIQPAGEIYEMHSPDIESSRSI